MVTKNITLLLKKLNSSKKIILKLRKLLQVYITLVHFQPLGISILGEEGYMES